MYKNSMGVDIDNYFKYPRLLLPRIISIYNYIKIKNFYRAQSELEKISEFKGLNSKVYGELKSLLEALIKKFNYQRIINKPYDFHIAAIDSRDLLSIRNIDLSRKQYQGVPHDFVLQSITGNRNEYEFILDVVNKRQSKNITFQKPSFDIFFFDGLLSESFCNEYNGTDINFIKLQQDLSIGSINDAIEQSNGEIIIFIKCKCEFYKEFFDECASLFRVSNNIIMPLIAAELGPGFSRGAIDSEWAGSNYVFRKVINGCIVTRRDDFVNHGYFDISYKFLESAIKDYCFRMWNIGFYLIPLIPGYLSSNENKRDLTSDNQYFIEKSPNHWDRKTDGTFLVPKVSIYIPAYNCSKYIVNAIDSILSQDYSDLTVNIYDDGSTDDTFDIITNSFSGENRIRLISGNNGGIGCASNKAIRISESMYIGQLDSDDRLKPGAIKTLVDYLDSNSDIGCVYSSCERIDAKGNYIEDEYSFPVFDRYKMSTTSIAHHFRMFRRQSWARTDGFREDIINAVDYDMFLKLSEVTKLHHVEEILYQRRWHGENTSNVNEGFQTKNSYLVLNKFLKRQSLERYWEVTAPDQANPRKILYKRVRGSKILFVWPNYSKANPYQQLLYKNVISNYDIIGGGIDDATKSLRDNKSCKVIFHLHWLNKIIVNANNENDAKVKYDIFVSKLKKFKWLGGKFIWTIHNTISHDSAWPTLEASISQELSLSADKVHIHAKSSLIEILKYFPIDAKKLVIHSHGNYLDFYPNTITRNRARNLLGLPSGSKVFLFTGQIRPYKGMDKLIDVFNQVMLNDPSVYLLIAGSDVNNVLSKLFKDISSAIKLRILTFPKFIADSDLQNYFNASDFTVYPYNKILTSGSLMLSLSFGVPSIVPRVGMTEEVINNTNAGILYDGDSSSELMRAVILACQTISLGQYNDSRESAINCASAHPWNDFNIVLDSL